MTKIETKIIREIDRLIDHYEPYRPILESGEAKEVRKVLWELREHIESLRTKAYS